MISAKPTETPAALITSTGNRRLIAARKLDDRKERQRQGRFLVEGLQLLHMALDGGARPLEVFYCESLFTGPEAPALLTRFRQAGAELVAVTAPVLQSLSERVTPQGLIATFAPVDHPLTDLAPQPCELVVVLDRLQDPGNLGTLLRTADAVGAAAVVLIQPCVDPYDPKAVRSSMGSLFNVPLFLTPDVPALMARLRRSGLRLVGAHAHQGVPWGTGLWSGGVALVLGNEARGLSEDVSVEIHDWAHLPMPGKADSLNVAVAGGILMYAWLRENSAAAG